MNLLKKRILITGGSSGLGFALAQALLNKGSNVFICGRDKNSLNTASKKLKNKNLKTFQCDVSNSKSVREMANNIGELDVLINNAGVFLGGNLEDHKYSKISEVIDTVYKGVIFVTRAFLSKMIKNDSGYVLNISSTVGTKARSRHSVYGSAKNAVRIFTDSLKLDLKDTKIKVAGFYPGGMRTSLFKNAGDDTDTSSYMDPEKVAEVIVFMLERDDDIVMDHVILNRANHD